MVQPLAAPFDPFEQLVELAAGFGVRLPDPNWSAMLEAMHPKQRSFVIDPSKRKCALAGRRAGKSYGIIFWLIERWRDFPRQTSLFVAQTLDHAREILWDDLKDICARFKLGVKFNDTLLRATFPNGYKIRLRGAENMKQAEKMRGPHYWRVVIDECHLFPDTLLRHLINRVIDPALMDLDGELCLCGTPGYDLVGLWYEATEDEKTSDSEDEDTSWTTHRWNCLDNPFIKGGGAAYIAKKKRENKWSDDNPELIREYFGHWFNDPSAKVYPYDGEKHLYWEEEWTPGADGLKTVIGVDTGARDGCGFVVAMKRSDGPEVRIVWAESEVMLDDGKIAARIKRLMKRFKTRNVFVDTGGNLTTALSLRKYGIPAEPAEKGAKRPRIEYVRALMIDGHLKAHPEHALQLIMEWETIPWKKDKDDPTIKLDHKDGFVDECADACINAVAELRQTWIQEISKHPEGSLAQLKQEAIKERKAAIERGQKKQKLRYGRRSSARVVP